MADDDDGGEWLMMMVLYLSGRILFSFTNMNGTYLSN